VTIVGYSQAGCRGDIVHTCPNIGPNQCCAFYTGICLSVAAELNSPTQHLVTFRPRGSQMCGLSVASGHPPPGRVCVTNPDHSHITGAMWTQPEIDEAGVLSGLGVRTVILNISPF
jgi:hypothetical protein